MANVAQYGLLNVHLRAAIGELLSPSIWRRLNRAADLNSLIPILKETSYAELLAQTSADSLNARHLSYLVRQRILKKFLLLIDTAPVRVQKLLDLLFRYYELNNLKVVFRGIEANTGWDILRYLLFPLGSLETLPFQAMLATGSIEQAISLIRDTPYYEKLVVALRRYKTEASLFPIEIMLDLDYWNRVWGLVNKLSGEDRKDGRDLIGQRIDLYNLTWAARFHVFNHLQEAEIINYTFGFAPTITDRIIRSIANGEQLASVIRDFYPQLEGTVDASLPEEKQLPFWEVQIDRLLQWQCRRYFLGNPFHLGPTLAYIFMLEFEVRDLILLFEAKTLAVPMGDYARFMVNQASELKESI